MSTEPAQAIEREAMPDDHRRQQETRYTKPQRHDVEASKLVVTANRVIALQLAQMQTAARPNNAPFR